MFKKFLIISCAFCLMTTGSMSQSDIETVHNDTEINPMFLVQSYVDFFDQVYLRPNRKDFIDYLSYGFSAREDLKFEYYVESIIPVYQSEDKNQTHFIQARVSYNGTDEDVYNLGWVWRRYNSRYDSLLGMNVFGDFQRDPGHGRVGVGADWLSHMIDARINSYFRIGPARKVSETDNALIYEKALNGFDAEIGMKLPFFDQIKIFGGGEVYDFKKGKNLYGWTGRLEYRPYANLIINFYLKDNNYLDDVEWRVDFRMSADELWDYLSETGGSDRKETELKSSETDIKNRAYERVERENRIIKERYGVGKNNGISFVVGRA